MKSASIPVLGRRSWAGLLVLGLALVTACGGGEDRTKARLRLVHASPAYGALDLVVADSRVQADVGYGATESYAEVDPADSALQVRRAGATAALYSSTPALGKGDRYSLVAYGREGALRAVLLDDNASDPDSGKARLRVLNGAAEAGALDVYLTPQDTALADSEALQADAQVGSVGSFAEVDAATWRLRVTAAGDADDLRLDRSGLVLGSRQIATLVLAPGAGGVLVQALLVTQRGAIEPLDNAQARVRAVAGVTSSGTVAAAVGGVPLLGSGFGSPAVGPYRLVPAGAAGAQLTVNGADVAVPAADLAAGADYTLLVWGPVATPAAAWLTDDNRPPSVGGKAKLRLVHGVADLANPISLTVDFSPLADGVAPGGASAYGSLDARSTAALSVTAPGLGAPLYSATDQVLAADAVYSLFVVGPLPAPTGILFKDR